MNTSNLFRIPTAISTMLVIGAAAVGVLVGAELTGRSATAQIPRPNPGIQRYSIASTDGNRVYYLDGVTGKLWLGAIDTDKVKVHWYELNTPASLKQ